MRPYTTRLHERIMTGHLTNALLAVIIIECVQGLKLIEENSIYGKKGFSEQR